MPWVPLNVVAVADEGDTVVVHGVRSDVEGKMRVAVVFRAKAVDADASLAERASRLQPGTSVVVDGLEIDDGWYVGRGLEIP